MVCAQGAPSPGDSAGLGRTSEGLETWNDGEPISDVPTYPVLFNMVATSHRQLFTLIIIKSLFKK